MKEWSHLIQDEVCVIEFAALQYFKLLGMKASILSFFVHSVEEYQMFYVKSTLLLLHVVFFL